MQTDVFFSSCRKTRWSPLKKKIKVLLDCIIGHKNHRKMQCRILSFLHFLKKNLIGPIRGLYFCFKNIFKKNPEGRGGLTNRYTWSQYVAGFQHSLRDRRNKIITKITHILWECQRRTNGKTLTPNWRAH